MAITYGATPDKSIFPKTISGLTLWLDANDSSTLFDSDIGGNIVTNDGGAIGRWQDKSGNNRNFTQGAPYRPILKKSIQNNKNVIRFDGVDDAMYLSSTISSVGSFFLVFKNVVKFVALISVIGLVTFKYEKLVTGLFVVYS